MEITYKNLRQAAAALRQCAKENENRKTDTGAVRVSDLCGDVAAFLTRLADTQDGIPHTDLRLEPIVNRRRFDKGQMDGADARQIDEIKRVQVADLLKDIETAGIVRQTQAIEPMSGDTIFQAELYVGLREGEDFNEMLEQGIARKYNS